MKSLSALLGITEHLPGPIREAVEGPYGLVIFLGTAVLALLLLAALASRLLGRKRSRQENEPSQSLKERLGEYPPPPLPPGPKVLTVEGIPGRLRLVVVAPLGKENRIEQDTVEDLLNGVLHGLKAVVAADKPRVRIWPGQLSHTGFAPAFHREVERPEAEGRPSRWVLAAGLARSGKQQLLLGLAVLADEESTIGRLTLEPPRWSEIFRIREVP